MNTIMKVIIATVVLLAVTYATYRIKRDPVIREYQRRVTPYLLQENLPPSSKQDASDWIRNELNLYEWEARQAREEVMANLRSLGEL